MIEDRVQLSDMPSGLALVITRQFPADGQALRAAARQAICKRTGGNHPGVNGFISYVRHEYTNWETILKLWRLPRTEGPMPGWPRTYEELREMVDRQIAKHLVKIYRRRNMCKLWEPLKRIAFGG
ncbi:MAG TPA: hypothetical protein PK280_16515 [Planctomycetota bacterium]|nr:hypothetical protein [Planctomycetota bacterium]